LSNSIICAGALLLLVALAAPACRSTPKPAPPREDPVFRGISVSEVAARLGLTVESSTERGAVLRDGANTVSLFPDPRGKAYVNGLPIGQTGGVTVVRGVLHLPPALFSQIHDALVPASEEIPGPVVEPGPPDPGPGPTKPRLGVVVVDAGHGGRDPGTPKRSTRKVRGNGLIDEKDVNLDAAHRLERHLKRGGASVVMTRTTDVFVTLDERPAVGNRHRARLFVSLHADAAANRSAHGFTIYVARRASARSLKAAALIRRELASTGVEDRGIRRADYRVLKNSRGPAVLVELGFLSNAAEARRLATATHREKMAAAVARGILAYLKSR